MTPDTAASPSSDQPLTPELERHLSNPAHKTEEVSGEQDRAAKPDASPTEPGTSTENQPT